MNKLQKLISRVLLVVLIVMQVAGTNGMESVHASSITKLSRVWVNGGGFDTGIKINQDYSIEMVFAVSDVSQYKNYYVAMTSDNQKVFRLRNEVGKGLYVAYGWHNGNVYTMKANEEMVVAQKKNVTYINNKQVQNAKVQNLQAATTLSFGDFKGYIKSFRIWNESNALAANYIPVLDANGKACMYDTINGKYLYYNGQCQAGEIIADESGNESEKDTTDEIKEEEEEKSSTSDSLESSEDKSDSNISFADVLEIAGGQFDSGLNVNLNYSLETVFSLSTLNQYNNIYESTKGNSRVFRLRYEQPNGFMVSYGWYSGKVYKPVENEKITLLQKKNITYINGNQVQKATVQTLESDTTLKFGVFNGTIESFRIWDESNKLVAEFLPALDRSNKACMYDTVSKKYFYYSGTCKAVVVEEEEVEEEEEIIEEEDNSFDSALDNGFVEDTVKDNDTLFKEELLEMLTTGDTTSHNISKYGYNDWQKVSTLYNDVINNEGLVAYNSCFNMYYSTTKNSSGVIQTIKLENIDSGYVKRYESMKKIVDDLVEQSAGMTEVEKVVLAHDYVAANCQYSNTGNLAYTAAGALVDKKAICVGYSRALIVLLKSMGVEAEYVSSQVINHAWVKVKVNGNWYHADPTWANTRSSVSGQVTHAFLLRTDAEYMNASSNRHYGWDGTVSTDQSFTNWNVHDIIGQLKYENGSWYYINYKNGQKTEVDINK